MRHEILIRLVVETELKTEHRQVGEAVASSLADFGYHAPIAVTGNDAHATVVAR